MRTILYSCLLLLSLVDAQAAVVVTYRGDDSNIFPVDHLPSIESLDMNNDGVDDFQFWRDAGFVAGLIAHGNNRFISTLATGFDLGGKVRPVTFGSIIGPDTTDLYGEWHHHTDNRGGSGFGLSTMQAEDAYIGVEFDIDGNIHYGWIEYTGFYVAEFVLMTPDGPIPFIGLGILGGFINSWAYESEPRVPIVAGIPEPSTYAATMGCLGLSMALMRRKRRSPRMHDEELR